MRQNNVWNNKLKKKNRNMWKKSYVSVIVVFTVECFLFDIAEV